MKARNLSRRLTRSRGRLCIAACVSATSLLANAADYLQCMQTYQKSLGIPGSPICVTQVAGTSPMSRGSDDPYNSMNYYNCPNASNWIKDYCNGVPVPPQADESCPVADPVLPAKGIVTLSESDFTSGDTSPLVFKRTYLSKSVDTSQTLMGSNWVNNWQRRIELAGAYASEPHIVAYRGNQQPLTFRWNGAAWVVTGKNWLSLAKAANGDFYLKDELRGTTEAYKGTTGQFYSESTRTGMIREVSYDEKQRIVDIGEAPIDRPTQSGLVISLKYDSKNRISTIVDPLGNATHYAYDVKGNLTSVTGPDGYMRQYLYEDARFPEALTGVVDETGSRTATWVYDSSGRASAATHPDTTRNTALSYGLARTTLKDMLGTSNYVFDDVDTLRPRSIETPHGTVSRSWDAAGNLKRRQTPEGDIQYTWDSVNRPVKSVATVAGKKTVTTIEYNDGKSLRPHLVATPGKVRAFVYDAAGNVTGYAERATTDPTGESGMQAAGTGSQLTVGARYDPAGRLLSATVVDDGRKTEDWTYSYDMRGNIALVRDAVSGWEMRTLSRNAANRATQIAGNSGQAGIAYDVRGRVSSFQYTEKAAAANGGLARYLKVDYSYAPDGTVLSRKALVSTNDWFPQQVTDAELDIWLTNWALGIDPVSPPANLTGLKSDANAFIPALCVECYMPWKANVTVRLFGDELSDALPKWGDTAELMLADQSQVPYPVLVPDLTSSAKRSMLFSTPYGASNDEGGMVKCGGRESQHAQCYEKYENDMDACRLMAKPRGMRNYKICLANAFDRYQQCRGF
nr:Putative deoxyribonuclease RhsC [Paraburkholderia busanensis]